MVAFVNNSLPRFALDDGLFVNEEFSAAGALTFPEGLILGRITASGKVTFFNGAAVDGTEDPIGVLRQELVTTGAGDTDVRVLTRGTVYEDKVLEWNAGTPHAPTAVELDQLARNGVFTQTSRELLKHDNTT